MEIDHKPLMKINNNNFPINDHNNDNYSQWEFQDPKMEVR